MVVWEQGAGAVAHRHVVPVPHCLLVDFIFCVAAISGGILSFTAGICRMMTPHWYFNAGTTT
jgi:hypothetical protein